MRFDHPEEPVQCDKAIDLDANHQATRDAER